MNIFKAVLTVVGGLFGLAVGAKGSTTQRTPAPNSHIIPGQHPAGRPAPEAPQSRARSPPWAQVIDSSRISTGSMFSFAVQVTLTLPGVQTNPSQHPALFRVAPHSRALSP